MAVCFNFIADSWRPHICRECFCSKDQHENATLLTTNSPPTSSEQTSINCVSQEKERRPCRYGATCYRKNAEHLKAYSHPPEHEENSSKESNRRNEALQGMDDRLHDIEEKTRAEEQRKAQLHVELVEKRFRESLAGIENEKKYLEESLEKSREDRRKMAIYHQQLEKALEQELDFRERREIERKRILEIKRDPPHYWGINAFDKSYREIAISSTSSEFQIVNTLMNGTIATHDNNYGTIYKKDPTEFIITSVIRVHNENLWKEYCFKKESIIAKHKNKLAYFRCSKYLKDYPCSVPLLSAEANEYWLFHGCDEDILPILLHQGYDPRVSATNGMFGGGFYLAENSSKSNQYIPCPGCGKNAIFYDKGCSCKKQENLEFSIILYRATLGDVHIAKEYDKKVYCGKEKNRPVRRPPIKSESGQLYDSVMGEKKEYGGDALQYREFILYESSQAYPEYVIKYRRSAKNARPQSDFKNIMDKCYNFLRNTFKMRPE